MIDYSIYNDSTQTYMNNVEKFLKKRYGKIQKEWEANLKQLADFKDLAKDILDSIKVNGVTVIDGRGNQKANPMINQYNNITKSILMLEKEFGITPSSLIHINNVEGRSKSKEEDNTLKEVAEALMS